MSAIESEQQHDRSSHELVDVNPSNVRAAEGRQPCSDPNAGAGDPTDGRKAYEWATHYPRIAWVQIIWEAIYLIVIFFISLFIAKKDVGRAGPFRHVWIFVFFALALSLAFPFALSFALFDPARLGGFETFLERLDFGFQFLVAAFQMAYTLLQVLDVFLQIT